MNLQEQFGGIDVYYITSAMTNDGFLRQPRPNFEQGPLDERTEHRDPPCR